MYIKLNKLQQIYGKNPNVILFLEAALPNI